MRGHDELNLRRCRELYLHDGEMMNRASSPIGSVQVRIMSQPK